MFVLCKCGLCVALDAYYAFYYTVNSLTIILGSVHSIVVSVLTHEHIFISIKSKVKIKTGVHQSKFYINTCSYQQCNN